MKLTQIPNLRVEDFSSEQSWIGRLFVSLNPFIQSLNQIINSNIDFTSNIKSVSKEYTITRFQEFSFQWPFTDSVPNDVRVTRASKTTQKTPTILLLAWSYDTSTKIITVTRMSEVLSSSVSELSGQYNFIVRATV